MRVRALTVMLLGLLAAGAAPAAVVQFQQVDWLDELGGYTSENSDWGRMTLSLQTTDLAHLPALPDLGYVGYLNVVTTVPSGHVDNWAVENLALAFDDISQPALDGRGEHVCLFDLGVTEGTSVTELQYRMVITDEALVSVPTGTMLPYQGVADFAIIKGGVEGTVPGSDPPEEFLGGTGKKKAPKAKNQGKKSEEEKKKVVKKKSKTLAEEELLKLLVDESKNGCAPGAGTRGLKYLEKTREEIDLLEKTTQEIYDDLVTDMKTDADKGTTKANFLSGKDAFTDREGLLIDTYQTTSFSDAMDAMDAGDAVEIMVYWGKNELDESLGGHAAFVLEIIELADDLADPAGYQITIVDDSNQLDDVAADDTQTLDFDTSGNLENFGTGAALIGFQIQTVVPEPGAFILCVSALGMALAFAVGRRRSA
jgi:hypothetical protein